MAKKSISRRRFLAAAAGTAAAIGPFINVGRYRLFAASDASYSDRAVTLVNESLVIDMLSLFDLGRLFGGEGSNPFSYSRAELLALKESGIDVFHPAVGIGETLDAMTYMAGCNGAVADNPDLLMRIDSAADLDAARNYGKIGIILDHIAKLVGIDHAGIGTDSDLTGYDALPKEIYDQLKAGYKGSYAFRDKIDIEGLNHPKKMYDVTEALIRRGYSDDNIRAVLGENFRRVLGEIWVS